MTGATAGQATVDQAAAGRAEVLRLRKLTAGHGGLAAVRGVDLELRAGQVVALLGPNGAGKTTLLETIAGFLPVMAGEVRVVVFVRLAQVEHQFVGGRIVEGELQIRLADGPCGAGAVGRRVVCALERVGEPIET